MRVIAGKYKGRTLFEFKGTEIRPTGEKAREALFDILKKEMVDAEFLDLFAGTGAVGIEALSRGAKHAVFCDSSKDSIALINKNIAKIGIEEYCEVVPMPALFALNMFGSRRRKFDIIFLDAPYRTKYGEEAIEIIKEKDLLNKNGIIILEKATTDSKKIKYESEGLELFDERRYGLNSFGFYRYIKDDNE